MNTTKRIWSLLLIISFLSAVFALSLPSVWDFDIWFHLKSGEIIAKQGIIRHDVFAFTTTGREWSPYEWLFQVIVYYQKSFFGFDSIKYLVAILASATIFLVLRIMRKLFGLNLFTSLLVAFFFFASTFEFYSPRPQIFAYLFLLINLYLVYLYFFKSKNFLYLTIPVTIIWANLHGSVFLGVALFLGYGIVSLINYFWLKEKAWLHKFKVFGIYTIITAVCTILPPLGTLQYQLLVRFFKERELISRFISEWGPLSVSPISFTLLLTTILFTLALFSWVNFKQKNLKQSLWILPLLPLVFSAFLASRNAFLSYLALSLILGGIVGKIKFNNYSMFWKSMFIALIAIVISFHLWMVVDKKREQNLGINYYPEQAMNFIKNNHLQGNMFNEYGFGGYLLYYLYPDQKVYIDGRTDLYLCCEMPDTLELSYKKNLSDTEYKQYIDSLLNKNNISFVVMRTEKHVVLRRIAHLLQNDSNWKLVFWDDRTIIFIKDDGKNNEVIKNFASFSATPYERDLFLPKTETLAFAEYQKMIKVADSAKSRNAIGYLLLKQNRIPEAKIEFEKALALNPQNESPYMNLAELALADNNLNQAISLYQKALVLAPDRGLIYIRLGQLMQQTGDTREAKKIWMEGLLKTIDNEAKKQLQVLIKASP